MPLCSLLVDSSWLLLVCHEMWKYQWVYFAVKFDEVSEVEPYFMATDIQTTVNNHAIKAVSNHPPTRDSTINDLYRRISLASKSSSDVDRCFIIGIYGLVHELLLSDDSSPTPMRVHDSMLTNTHFVQHSRAFVVFYHSGQWPHPQEDDSQCRRGFTPDICPLLYDKNLCKHSHSDDVFSERLSLLDTSLKESCYKACLDNKECMAVDASDTECRM